MNGNLKRTASARVLLLLSSILIVPMSAFGISCKELFSEARLLPDSFLTYSPKKNNFSSQISTASVVEGRQVEQGQRLSVIRRNTEDWFSTYRIGRLDLQGDPRWFAMVLGPQAAYQFGFRYLSDTEIAVPSPGALNFYVQRVNQKLRLKHLEEIPVRFYESDSLPVTGLDYLKALVKNMALPMAAAGPVAIHDVSYHTLSIVFPKTVMRSLQLRLKFLIDLDEYFLKNKRLDLYEKKLAKMFIDRIISKAVEFVDFGSGNLGYLLAMQATRQRDSYGHPFNADSFQSSSFNYIMKELPRLIRKSEVLEQFGNSFADEITNQLSDPENVYFDPQLDTEMRMVKGLEMKNRIQLEIESFFAADRNGISTIDQNISPEQMMVLVQRRIREIRLTAESLSF